VWKYCHLRHTGRLPDRLFSDMPFSSPSLMNFCLGEYQPVLEALGTGQYEDRTMKSISEEIDLDKGTVNKALNWLLENGLVQKRTAEDGTFWSLTEEGWKVYKDIHVT
jgi:predicted transcriptional regulator